MKLTCLILIICHCMIQSNGAVVLYCAITCCTTNCAYFNIRGTHCSAFSNDNVGMKGTTENDDRYYRQHVMKSIEYSGLTYVRYRRLNQVEETMEPHFERLILFNRYDNDQIYDIDLETKKAQKYRGSLHRVKAAIYMHRAGVVLVCEGVVPVVSKLSRGGDHRLYNKSLFLEENVRALAADEFSCLVFFLNFRVIFHVNPQGENRSVVYRSKSPKLVSLIVDTKSKRLFLLVKLRIVVLDYKGKTLTTVECGKSVFTVAFDSKENFLYCNVFYYIKRHKVDGTEKSTIARLKSLPRQIVIYRGRMFVAGDKNVIEVVGLTGNSSVDSLLKTNKRFVMCLM